MIGVLLSGWCGFSIASTAKAIPSAPTNSAGWVWQAATRSRLYRPREDLPTGTSGYKGRTGI